MAILTSKERLEYEKYIHKFYPRWDLSEKSDTQVCAIYLRLLRNQPPVARLSKDEGSMYHQITIEEYLLGGLK